MKRFLIFIFCFGMLCSFAQKQGRWADLFSYNNVLKIRKNENDLIAASSNGLFFYNIRTGEISKLSKANGLHEVKISAFDYNPKTKTALIGYESGAMDVINPDGIFYIVDIPIAQSYTGSKAVNSISINGNKAIISANYGVSVFDLKKKEFGDTAFFRESTNYTPALSAFVKDNVVYAATKRGVISHTLDVSFSDYSTWQTLKTGNFILTASNEQHSVFATKTAVYLSQNLSTLSQSFQNITDLSLKGDSLIVSDANSHKVYLFNASNGSSIGEYSFPEMSLSAAYAGDEGIFAGTKHMGMVKYSDTQPEKIKPDGPYNNQAYKMSLSGDKILVSTGDRNDYNTPFLSPDNLGFYFYNGSQWIYPSYFTGNNGSFNVLDVAENPVKSGEIFFTNYTFSGSKGIYKCTYDKEQNDIQNCKQYSIGGDNFHNRPVGLAFTESGTLFNTASFIGNDAAAGIFIYDRQTDSFDKYNDLGGGKNISLERPLVHNSTLWCPMARTSSFLIYDYNNTPENLNDDRYTILDQKNGFNSTDSSEGSLSVAIDNNDTTWIGTKLGLKILNNINGNLENAKLEPIVIIQSGIPEELFRNASILSIAVDSGNNKWVSVSGGGVYYLSSDGQKTIQHFTKENSPLPVNNVTDIQIDDRKGIVYFATKDGIVAYTSDVKEVGNSFNNVLVYPNPVVTKQYRGNVTIRGLADKTNIRITDVTGNLVHQGVVRGGFYEWNLRNQNGQKVASGIYFVLMTNSDGTETATAKIAVVN